MGFQIAIDGPSGAGKSTIAKCVAGRLGFIYVDTGAMYRAVALHLIRKEVNPENQEAISAACLTAEVTLRYENGEQQVYLNGENVNGLIRTEPVSRMSSYSSAVPKVRERLLDLQRELAEQYDVVMDGRDIGTHVLPDARVKIFLTASVEVRARRRYEQLLDKGESADYEQVKRDIAGRDENDMNRRTDPLRQAQDAVLIDSSALSVDEVTERILALVEQAAS